jgi:hypothetical protein
VAEWVAAIAAVVAALIAAVALGVALRGKETAEQANRTSANALDEAKKANGIADDANTIAERALRVAQDDVPYHWVLEVGDDGVAVLINDCGHPASQATVVLDSAGRIVAETEPVDVVPFGKISLDASSTIEQHFDAVRKNPVVYAHSDAGMVFGGRDGAPVAANFRAHVRWLTEQEIPRNDVVELVLRHQMTHEGLQRARERRPAK